MYCSFMHAACHTYYILIDVCVAIILLTTKVNLTIVIGSSQKLSIKLYRC
jgi:hypothetical protein